MIAYFWFQLNPDGPFSWNKEEQGHVLSSYYYGYVTTQIAGAWAAENISAKYFLGVSLVLNGLANMLIPVMANSLGYGGAMASRIVQGIFAVS